MHSKFHGWVRLLGLAGLAIASAAFGQGAKNYPDKPVRVVVGYSPGGLPDTIARLIGQKLSVRSGLVLDHELLAPALGELLADEARDGVGQTARRIAHDHAHRLVRIALRAL